MLSLLRKITPKPLKRLYHRFLATFARMWYHAPSEQMIVIGVTGTSGKSTVCYMLAHVLEHAGFRVGVASTIQFKIDKKEWLNDKKMTMIGRMQLQKLLSQMAKANCQYAIIETTSEGIEQFRHTGINYDIAVFTNLYPEHIQAHGSFENYKNAKLKLFKKLEDERKKEIGGQVVPKVIVANLDNEHVAEFLQCSADVHYGFTTTNTSSTEAQVIRAENISASPQLEFTVEHQPMRLRVAGEHNISNALAVTCVARSQGIGLESIAKGLEEVTSVPGRIEFIDEGQNFKVIVDYAFEPKAMNSLYQAVKNMQPARIIHVLGGTGGGRDTDRRPKIGAIAGEHADVVIVTNEDPYDEDPKAIMQQVAEGVKTAGKKTNKDLFLVQDRRKAIAKALELAESNDAVLITGKGSEQGIVGKNRRIEKWDDREVVRAILKSR